MIKVGLVLDRFAFEPAVFRVVVVFFTQDQHHRRPRRADLISETRRGVVQGARPCQDDAVAVQIHATARRGGQIDASAVYDSLDVLTAQDGEVGGRTYLKAQCKLILSAVPQGDGSVRVQILPQVHHGQAKPGFTSFGQGILRMTTSRPSQSFEELQIIASLAPGDMLVLGCLTDRQGSLGHAFFTGRPAGPLEQKLIIVRVIRSVRDDLFAADAVDE